MNNNPYKIQLGVYLDTKNLRTEINQLDDKYKLKLGVDLKVNDIRDRIKQYNQNGNNAKLKLGIKLDTDDLKQQINKLNLNGAGNGKGIAVPVDTQSLETSLREVKDIIADIKSSIGSLDSKSGLNSLLTSVNQIASALDKATDESNGLLASLNALSKKDFNFKIGLDMGNKNNNMIAYGRTARKQIIPELESQITELESLLGGQQTVMKKLMSNSKNIGFDIFADFNDFNSDSAIKKMEAMEKYVNSMKKLAAIDNVDLSGFNEVHKNASELINDVVGVENAIDKAGDIPDKLKNIFGNSIDGEGLSVQLNSIVSDLAEIKTAIQGLSSGVSIDGLTQSFDRLSETLEKLMTNAKLVQDVFGSITSSTTSINTGAIDKVENKSDESTAAVVRNEKKKQEAYKATTDTVLYHAGIVSKLNKAETNGRFYGSNRGTGYFGTGHYFVDSATKNELDNNPHYSKMPYTSIDASQYDNLFKVASDEIGYALHDFLRDLTKFTQGSDNLNIDELFADFKKVFGNTVMDVEEFGQRINKLKTFMSNSYFDDRSDSVSTQFMKSLGYGGVDTRGTNLANTAYGTVIYDLKEESILQANITDELQKQGQMLEKINYKKGQVFDSSADAKIQAELDAKSKKREIIDEYENIFDSSKLDKADEELSNVKNRIDEINRQIETSKYEIENLDDAYEDYLRDTEKSNKELSSFGIDFDELDDDWLLYEDEGEWKENRLEFLNDYISQLSREKEELQSKIPVLEEVRNKEEQLSTEAYEQAKRTVEQRHLEAQQAKQVADSVVKAENEKQEAIKQTSSISESTDISDDFKEAEVEIESTENQVEELTDALRSFGLNDGAVDAMTKDFEELGIAVKKIKSTLNEDGSVRLNIDGIDKFGNKINTNREIDADGNISESINTSVIQYFNESEQAFKRLKTLGKEISQTEIKIAGLDADKNKSEINELITYLNKLETEYDDLFNVNEKNFSSNQIDELVQDIVNGCEKLDTVKAKISDVRNELAKSIKVDIELGNYDDKIDALRAKTDSLSKDNVGWRKSVEEVELAYKEMIDAAKVNTGDAVADREKLIRAEEKYAAVLEKSNNLAKQQHRLESAEARSKKLVHDKESLKLDTLNWMNENTRAAKAYGNELRELISLIDQANDNVALQSVARQIKNVKKEAQVMGKTGLTVFDKLKAKAKEYASYLSAAELFMYAEQTFRSMFEQVKLIDSAMTELKKVTNETDAAYDSFLSNAASRAKEIGTTIDGLVNSTADFARLGYSFTESQELAEVANIYAVVGDEIDGVETATESLISTMTAFGIKASDSMSIVDKFNIIGNNFAISSGGIGDALERSASSMAAANNTLDETIALITAANTVVQDADAVGTAFKTISMRIRGATTDLEEAGLDTEGMASSTAKLREEIMALSGVDIMLDSTTFKSTYKIMEELAAKWKDLTDIQQASVTELIAGKRQGNIVSSLMTNFDIAQNALQTSLNASGSAMEEHAKYMDSIDAKLSQLKASWQSFAQTFMDSNLLKGGINVLKTFVDVLEQIVDKFGLLGTIGLGSGIFGLFKSRGTGLKTNILGELSAFTSLTSDIWKSGGKLIGRFKDIGSTAKMAGGSIVKHFGSSLTSAVTGIGLLVSVVGLAINAYKSYREEQSRLRQETIETSNAFLDSAISFEQAYAKYSGKTDLTTEEEAELESAIHGTVDALGDKSSALQSVVNSSNDYLASLDQIANAELQAAKAAAIKKRDAAELELKESAFGWSEIDSEVDVSISDSSAEKIASEMNSVYFNKSKKSGKSGGNVKNASFKLSGDADVYEIIDYYNTLLDYQNRLSEANLKDTYAFESVSSAINAMSDSISTYTNGIYDAVKADYQLKNGIPKTVEAYLEMRNAILNSEDIKKLSLNDKKAFANTLDSEYGQIFDLNTAEIQSKKLIGILDGFDKTKAGEVETFLNMRTAVNNNECTVGEYMSQFNNINKMANEWSGKEKEEFNLAFGLDTDSIKEQYDNVYNYLSRNYLNKDTRNMSRDEEYNYKLKANESKEKIQEFLNSLSADELSALVNIKTEIDWKSADLESVRKQIEDESKLQKALVFEASIEVDKTSLEALNTALEESASAMGLSSESIDSLTAKYKDLDGFDAAKLFERTANGVKVNRTELEKLEKQSNDLTKTEVQKYLDTLVDKYNDVTKEIDKCSNASERAELFSEREGYKSKIEELAEYQAQLEGVTGAYQDWINAQNTPEDYEGYEAVATGRETVQDELDRHLLGNASREYIDLLSGDITDGATKNGIATIDDYAEAWERLDDVVTTTGYSINDFFTINDDGDITGTGIGRFFESVKEDFDGIYNSDTGVFDFSSDNIKAISDKYKMGIDAIELLLEAAPSAGYTVDWDGILDGIDFAIAKYEDLVENAEAAQETFNSFKLDGVNDIDFDFTTTNIEDATSELKKAKSLYEDIITNDDGSINLDAKGAKELRDILFVLTKQKQELERPAIMDVEIPFSEVESDLGKATKAVQDLQNDLWTLEQSVYSPEINSEEFKAEAAEIQGRLRALQDLSPEILAEIGLDEAEIESLKAAVGNIQADIKAGIEPKQEDLAIVQSTIQGIDATVVANVLTKNAENTTGTADIEPVLTKTHFEEHLTGTADIEPVLTKTDVGTLTGKARITPSLTKKSLTVEVNTVPKANGTANVNGTTGRAYAHGDWGIKGSGTALVGELGMETLVRSGKFYTIGNQGAEFIKYRQGDIIFNHKQTEELFKNGKVTSDGGRGRMFVNGSAFANGSYPSSGRAFSNTPNVNATVTESNFSKQHFTIGYDYGASSDKDSDKNQELFDWIEVAIKRIEREIDNLDKITNSTYKSWSDRNAALVNEINEVGNEISLQQAAYEAYMSAANEVGLSSEWAKKVQNGAIDIDNVTDETLKEKIQHYQQWYEKALACEDAILELKETESELYAQRFQNIQTQYDGILQGYEHTESMLNEYISQSEEKGYIVSKQYYEALIENEKASIEELKREQAELIAARDEAVASGKITKYSEEWYNMCQEIDNVTQSIEESETSVLEFCNAIRDIDWSVFDLIQERISDITEESDFLIELMSNKKLFEDDGKLTSQGLATMALHGQNYNTYMYQADDYGAQVAELDKQIANDPYDQNLISRRNELLELQRESILAAEDEKEAIRDMVEEGINLELDALQELIDKKNEELESERDLYEYQKKVKEQTEEIASLEKQMMAYQNDDSEEAKQKIQQIKVDLESARQDLQETEYDKFINDSAALLDELYLEYETILNTRLDNIDYLLEQVIDSINVAAGAEGVIATALGSEGALAIAIGNNTMSIGETLKTEVGNVGAKLSSAMNSIWLADGSGKAVLDYYGQDFQSKATTTNDTLNKIKVDIAAMVDDIDKNASKKANENKTSPSANTNPTTSNPPKSNNDNKTPNTDKPKITEDTLKGIASAIWIYGSDSGWGNNPFRENKLKQKIGEANANKVQDIINSQGLSGKLYDFWIKNGQNLDKYKFNAFKSGAKDIDVSQLAWTQENGREFIIRPSDGAILTPVAKGDSVLNATASGNIWQMANNPAEFIKNNLGLDGANIPNSANVNNTVTQNFENITFSMPNIHGYNELLTEMQRDPKFEKLILSMTIDQIAGKSSLAKGKSIR